MQNTQEQGRSLTEMLGVLAVIGVLSITAIAGFKYAMNKYQENILMNDVRTIATLILADKWQELEKPVTATDKNIETASKRTYYIMKETDETFYIAADLVEEGVCKLAVKESVGFLEEIVANPNGNGKCQAGMNTVYFYVNGQMDSAQDDDRFDRCDDTHPCGECGVCTEGRCMDSDDKCVAGEYCVQGTCQGCKKGEIQDANGVCKPCNYPEVINATQDKCNLCPERTWERTVGGSCQIKCGVGINKGKPLRHYYFGKCYACKDPTMVDVSHNPSSCTAICPNRVEKYKACMLKDVCPPDKPLQNYGSGGCYSCDYTGYIWLGETGGMRAFCAELCPNRVLIGQGNQFCNLPCKAGVTFENIVGLCLACSFASDVQINNGQWLIASCNACPEREVVLGDPAKGQNPALRYCNRKVIP